MRGMALLGRQQSLHSGNQRLRTSICSISRPLQVPQRPCRPSQRSSRQSSRAAVRVVASLDYIATASDEGVLKLPARTELDPEEIKTVFGYPRYVYCSCSSSIQCLAGHYSLQQYYAVSCSWQETVCAWVLSCMSAIPAASDSVRRCSAE